MERILWIAAGFAPSAGLVWWALRPPEVPPAPAEPVLVAGIAVPPEAPCPDRRPALEAARDALRAEIDGLGIAAQILEAQRIEREGVPVPWPEDPGDLAPDVIEATLRSAVAATSGVEVLGLECDEYPCLLLVARTDRTTETDAGLGRFDELLAELASRGLDGDTRYRPFGTGAVSREGEGRQHFGVIAFGRDGHPTRSGNHTRHRGRAPDPIREPPPAPGTGTRPDQGTTPGAGYGHPTRSGTHTRHRVRAPNPIRDPHPAPGTGTQPDQGTTPGTGYGHPTRSANHPRHRVPAPDPIRRHLRFCEGPAPTPALPRDRGRGKKSQLCATP